MASSASASAAAPASQPLVNGSGHNGTAAAAASHTTKADAQAQAQAQAAPHTSDTFRPLLKKLTLSCVLPAGPHDGIAPPPSSSSSSSTHAPSPAPLAQQPAGSALSGAELLSLFEHLADVNYTSSHANHAQIGAALTALRLSGTDRDPQALAIASSVFLRRCLRVDVDADAEAEHEQAGAGQAQARSGARPMARTASSSSASALAAALDQAQAHAPPAAPPAAAAGAYTGILDIVGTGGDGQDTFNVSTTAAIVAAGVPGIRVCKHGAKASSSTSGSVDLLLSLGIPLSRLPPQALSDVLPHSSFAFLYAQLFHPSLGPLAPIRRALGFPTLFNVLGPLINPAQPRRCVLGVHSYGLGRTFAEALQRRGDVSRAWVVCGREGLDEISCAGETDVWELTPEGEIVQRVVCPEDFGLQRHPLAHVGSYSSDENAAIVRRLLAHTADEQLPLEPLDAPQHLAPHELPSYGASGTPASLSSSVSSLSSAPGTPGGGGAAPPPIPAGARLRALADYTLLQAGALLYVAGAAGTLRECAALARAAMQSGAAKAALERFALCANLEIAKAEEREEERARAKAEEEEARRAHTRKARAAAEAAAADAAAAAAAAADGEETEVDDRADADADADAAEAAAARRRARQRIRSHRERADSQLQDGFAYFPVPQRDANVGTDD